MAIDTLLSALPTEMTVGGRNFDLLGCLRGDEKSVLGHTIIERAKEMNARSGKEERDHILKHQREISPLLRGKVGFVFTDEHPDYPERMYYICCVGDCWVESWSWLDGYWDGSWLLIRPK